MVVQVEIGYNMARIELQSLASLSIFVAQVQNVVFQKQSRV